MSHPRSALLKRLVPIGIGQAVGLACGLIGVRLVTQWVEPEHYGRYTLFVSFAPLGASVIFAGLSRYTARHWVETRNRASLVQLVTEAGIRKLPVLLAATLGLAWILASGHLAAMTVALFVAALGLALVQFAQTILQAEQLHWVDCGLSTLSSLTRTFLPLLIYMGAAAKFEALHAGFVLHTAIATGLGILLIRWRAGYPGGEAGSREIGTAYGGITFTLLALVGWGLAGLNRWLAVACFEAQDAGFLALAANIASIAPMVLAATALQLTQPAWFKTDTANPSALVDLLRRADRVALGYAVLALGSTVALHLLMPFLVGSLIGVRYAAAADLVLPTGSFATAVMIPTIYHAVMLAARRERECSIPELSGAALLVAGAVTGACLGWRWFLGWLTISPLVPLLVNRLLVRRILLKPAASRGSATGP